MSFSYPKLRLKYPLQMARSPAPFRKLPLPPAALSPSGGWEDEPPARLED